MAQVVVGVGSSHSPQVSLPWNEWRLLTLKDEADKRFDFEALVRRAGPAIHQQLTQEKWRERGEAVERGVRTLQAMLQRAEPEVLVVFGDDQHEQFLDDNLPMLSIYHGETLPVVTRAPRNTSWDRAEVQSWSQTEHAYPCARELAEHLISRLVDEEFDLARSNRLREGAGLGHAFAFVYRRLWTGGAVPMVPVMINTYFPPNQPTPRRCYAFGQAVRRAIESWDSHARVAVIASGGLSHHIIDEELDRTALEAMQRKDARGLVALPRERLQGGSSEILNWVALAGAMEAEPMSLLAYAPGYRSTGATGCGMAFAYWNQHIPAENQDVRRDSRGHVD